MAIRGVGVGGIQEEDTEILDLRRNCRAGCGMGYRRLGRGQGKQDGTEILDLRRNCRTECGYRRVGGWGGGGDKTA